MSSFSILLLSKYFGIGCCEVKREVLYNSPLSVGEMDSNNKIVDLPEGLLRKDLVNRYEENLYNRTFCINFYDCRYKNSHVIEVR